MINVLISSSNCSDYALASTLATVQKVFEILCIITPILLILSIIFSFIGFMIQVDQKNKSKKIIQKTAAALFIFTLPRLVNSAMGWLDYGLNEKISFSVASCWTLASKTKGNLEEVTYNSGSGTKKKETASSITADLSALKNYSGGGLNFTDFEHLKQYNQDGQYRSRSVCSWGGNNVGGYACGLSVYMATRYVLTKKDTNFMSFCHEACNTGFFNGKGATWQVCERSGGLMETKYGIKSHSTGNNYENYVKELKKGNVIVVMIRNGSRNVEAGGFNATANGHFIALVGYDSSNRKIYVYNPNSNNMGWHTESEIERFVVKPAKLVRTVSAN